MNKFDKLQKDYLAAFLKDDQTWYAVSDPEKGLTYIGNKYMIGVIDYGLVGVATDLGDKRPSVDTIRKFLKNEYGKHLHDTGMSRMEGRVQLRIFEIEDGEKFYIDNKFLKYFEKIPYTLWGTNYKSPVHVMYLDEVIGLIFPVNMGGGKKNELGD